MIELKHISGGYGTLETVHDISLTFPDGLVTAIIGPNGCGKSTLLNLCGGQLIPFRGEVFTDEISLTALNRTEIARRIALLPQSRTVPDITVGSLVLHGRFPWLDYPRVYKSHDREAAIRSMQRLGIEKKRHSPLSMLSGGERQKAYLAMLLAQDTGNILLDEPTTYLDISYQLELFSLLAELKQEGKSVIAVLHDIGMVMDLADRIAVIKEGRLLFAGTPEQVMASGAVEDAFGVKIIRRKHYQFTK